MGTTEAKWAATSLFGDRGRKREKIKGKSEERKRKPRSCTQNKKKRRLQNRLGKKKKTRMEGSAFFSQSLSFPLLSNPLFCRLLRLLCLPPSSSTCGSVKCCPLSSPSSQKEGESLWRGNGTEKRVEVKDNQKGKLCGRFRKIIQIMRHVTFSDGKNRLSGNEVAAEALILFLLLLRLDPLKCLAPADGRSNFLLLS